MDRVIRHVLIHEIGHHFGFSDADMALIEVPQVAHSLRRQARLLGADR